MSVISEPLSDRKAGRPVRFMAMVLCLWIGGRAVMISSSIPGIFEAGASPLAAIVPPLVHSQSGLVSGSRTGAYHGRIATAAPSVPVRRLDHIPIVRTDAAAGYDAWAGRTEAPLRQSSFAREAAAAEALPAASGPDEGGRVTVPPVAIVPAHASVGAKRWSGSAWLFWRDKQGGAALNSAGQLGGAQSGVRIDRHIGHLGKGLPVALYARITNALERPAIPEAALGLALRPISGRVPLTIGIERRVALDGDGRNAFALVAAGGLNPTRLGGPIIAEGYAQAGMVGLSQRDMFADGRLSVTVPLDRRERTGIGLSVSGGAQPHVSRLDIGPVLEARLPLGRIVPRFVVEWRQRIGGDARPDSGLAVTLAGDF